MLHTRSRYTWRGNPAPFWMETAAADRRGSNPLRALPSSFATLAIGQVYPERLQAVEGREILLLPFPSAHPEPVEGPVDRTGQEPCPRDSPAPIPPPCQTCSLPPPRLPPTMTPPPSRCSRG